MARGTLVAISVAVTLFGIAAQAPLASATPGTPISAFITSVSSTEISNRTADGNTIITTSDVFVLSGDINGTIVGQDTAVVQKDGCVSDHGYGTFTGNIAGGSGLGTAKLTFTSGAGHCIGARSGVETGNLVFDGGASGLAGVHVKATYDASLFPIPITGQVHFD